MLENLVPMVIMTGMFAMIFGIAYIRSRENMAMIEKGLNPRHKDTRPRPFINLKWGLLLIGSGLGLLFAYIIDRTVLKQDDYIADDSSIVIGGHHSHGKMKAIPIADTNQVTDTSMHKENTVAITIAGDNDGKGEDSHSIAEIKGGHRRHNPAIYFALIAIGGGLGLFFSYRIEKKEWLDKKIVD